MNDKEAVRSGDEGKLRFDNTLDALGILSKFAPNTKEQIKPSIDKINKVRKADVSKSTYVRLSDYDEKRAEKAIKDIQKKAAEKNTKKNAAKKPAK